MTDLDENVRRGLELQARLPGYDRPEPDRKHSRLDTAADAFAATDLAVGGGAVGLVIALVAFIAWLLGRRRTP